ncbi:MAG TPA: hypothetical protein VGE57_11425 [Solimonas sp.]
MTVVIASELGAGYGHATQISLTAQCVVELGHRPVAVTRDIGTLRTVIGYQTPCDVLAAPVRLRGAPQFTRVHSFADILVEAGFAELRDLTARLRAWVSLFELCKADHLVLDHAPTALFAAHAIGLPCVATTSSFSIPPAVAPFPSILPNAQTPPAVREQRERQLLALLSQALGEIGLKAPDRLQDPFAHLPAGLANIAELDHYGPRAQARYLGCASHTVGTAPQWPLRGGARLFFYAPWHPAIREGLQHLVDAGHRICAVIPNAPADAPTADNLVLHRHLVDIHAALDACEIFVGHCSIHSLIASLRLGKPCVMLPLWQEQNLLAHRVVQTGAGLTVTPQTIAAAVAQMLQQMPTFAAAAQAFSQRHAAIDSRAAHLAFLRDTIGARA